MRAYLCRGDTWKMTIEGLIKLYNSQKLEGIEVYNGHCYHYTSLESANKIRSEKIIYASNITSLGDRSEWNYVLDLLILNIKCLFREYPWAERLIRNRVDEVQNNKESLKRYVISLSMDGDSEFLKGNYASYPCGGAKIEFDTVQLVKNIQIQIEKENCANKEIIIRNPDRHLYFFHGKVIYDKKEQLRILERIINVFMSKIDYKDTDYIKMKAAEYVVDKALMYGLFFKKSGFKREKEYRICAQTIIADTDEAMKKNFPFKEHMRLTSRGVKYCQPCSFGDYDLIDIKPL